MKIGKAIKFAAAFLILFLPIVSATQTGGDFAITQSTIASGGGQNSSGGIFAVDGTVGQTASGLSAAQPFGVSGGFWNFNYAAPTAANASVSGRVLTASGNGIRNAIVSLTSFNGDVQITQTGAFGYYRFSEVPVGETYILTVTSKRFTFSQATIIITVNDEVADANFVADPQ